MGDRPSSTHFSVSWRSVATALSTLLLGLAAALVVIAAVGDAGVLATVALVLAVVAFVAQLIIFVAQIATTTSQLQQAERINSETSAILADLSSRLARLDETQFQQFTEIREQLLPRALGEQMVDSIDRAVDDVAKSDPRMANRLERALASVRETIELKTEREYSVESVPCPFCRHHSARVRIGSIPGDSAAGECPECGNRFHVHRNGDGRLFTVQPGRPRLLTDDPEEILRRNQMQLPDEGDRLRLLSQFVDEWRSGAIKKGHDVTGWMDYPSRVRTPFFFALVNHDYGNLRLVESDDERVGDRDVEPPSDPFDEAAWVSSAHAAWIAQALYRLRAWRRTRKQELLFFFGENHTKENEELLELAHEYDELVRSADDAQGQADEGNGARAPDESAESLEKADQPTADGALDESGVSEQPDEGTDLGE